MSAPEIATYRETAANSPLTKKVRTKNSLFHREVRPDYKEGMGLGKHPRGGGVWRGFRHPMDLFSGCPTQPRLAAWPSPRSLEESQHHPTGLARSGHPNVEGPWCPVYTCLPISHGRHSPELWRLLCQQSPPKTPHCHSLSPIIT